MADTHTLSLGGKVFSVEDSALTVLNRFFEELKQLSFTDRQHVEAAVADDIAARLGSLDKPVTFDVVKSLLQHNNIRDIILNRYDFVLHSASTDDIVKVVSTAVLAAQKALVKTEKINPENGNENKSAPNNSNSASQPNTGGEQKTKRTDSSTLSSDKKLFRDPHDTWLFGLLSGMAHYFDMEVTAARIIFLVVMFFAAGWVFPIYFIMAMIVPLADTPEKQRRMFASPTKYEVYKIIYPQGTPPKSQAGCAKGCGIGCLVLIALFIVACVALVNSDYSWCEGQHGGGADEVQIIETTMPRGQVRKLMVKGNMTVRINPADSLFYDSGTGSFSTGKYITEISANETECLDSIVFSLKDDGLLIIGQSDDMSGCSAVFTLPCDLADCDSIVVLGNAAVMIDDAAAIRKNTVIMAADNANVITNAPTDKILLIATDNAEVTIGEMVKSVNVSAMDNAKVSGHESLLVNIALLDHNAVIEYGSVTKSAADKVEYNSKYAEELRKTPKSKPDASNSKADAGDNAPDNNNSRQVEEMKRREQQSFDKSLLKGAF